MEISDPIYTKGTYGAIIPPFWGFIGPAHFNSFYVVKWAPPAGEMSDCRGLRSQIWRSFSSLVLNCGFPRSSVLNCGFPPAWFPTARDTCGLKSDPPDKWHPFWRICTPAQTLFNKSMFASQRHTKSGKKKMCFWGGVDHFPGRGGSTRLKLTFYS